MEKSLFPLECNTPGKKIEYVSKVLMPQRRFEDYQKCMNEILDENIHYIDPVHELKGKSNVLDMFQKVVPRAANEKFLFELIEDTPNFAVWKWTISLKIRFTWFEMKINGLVHAKIKNNKIYYQREYYDPMESADVIPLFGKLYKLMLKMG